jgi:membrane protease YdiL (CAAX protease family)
VQWLLKRKDSVLAQNHSLNWSVPWNWETILQVFLLGFFLVGQLVVPIVFSLVFQSFNLQPATFAPRSQAVYVLVTYLILMSGGLSVLYFSIQSFFPLPEGWFQFNWRKNWFLWGLGGYLTALPLVILVSLINQQIWDGQGGSNPILPIALENRDSLALFIFFITASVAAPVFEEIFFRGFLLPSLTRYVPVWGAILLSSLVFAAAHLNISEVLPLTILGIILGVVYTRSRNLLSSMLLHGLWNSGTLLSLYVLGSGTN